jgi:hypothetical protein
MDYRIKPSRGEYIVIPAQRSGAELSGSLRTLFSSTTILSEYPPWEIAHLSIF